MKLSAVVIAKDEEKKIADCLESLSWVDEVVLVDTGSEDGTVEIAKKFGAKVFTSQGGSYSEWRNRGFKAAAGEWILYVDADERVTPLLKREILSIVNRKTLITNHPAAYAIPRRNFILGKELKHGGWWPDYVKRLFLKSEFTGWSGELHEEPHFSGSLGHLENPLIHIKHDKLEQMVEKTNTWSDIEAELMFKAHHPKMNIVRFTTAMFREFWLRMIRYMAFLDGTVGIIYATYQVYSRFISYAKLWEMQLGKFEARNSKS